MKDFNPDLELELKLVKPLSECSHTKGVDGKKVSETNPSEWAYHNAATKFGQGAVVKIKDLLEAIEFSVVTEQLLELSRKGYLDEFVNDSGDITFEMTPKGRKFASKDIKKLKRKNDKK